MSALRIFLLALIFLVSGTGYTQTLPEYDPKSDQTTEWDVIHLHNTEKPYEGVNKAMGTTSSNETVSFPSDNDLLGVKFDRYLKRNKKDLENKNITLLRFVMDKENNFSAEQKNMLSEVAKNNGFKIRFETVRIDWEARRQKLQQAGEEIIDESVPEELRNKAEVEIEIKKTKKGFRKFWNDIYETPTRSEVYGGVTKGVITMALTMGAWAGMGMEPASALFWVLTSEHILQEIFFGPYIKTYVNFLYKKVKTKAGDLGVAMWGNVQGFVLFSFDKYLIYLGGLGTGPWDPQYLAGYFGMATIGSLLGGFMPVGVFKLIQKGYINRSQGMLSMQALDLIMPVEGALLAFDSPWLGVIFGIHQAVKFGVYIGGRILPQKGTLIMVPSDVYNTSEAQSYLNLEAIPSSDIFKSEEKTLEFFRDEAIPRAVKANFMKYINNIFNKDAELVKNNPEFRGILKSVVEATAVYVGEEEIKLNNEIKENIGKTGFSAMFKNEKGDFELGYSFSSWSHFWATANQVRKDSSYVSLLKKKLKTINKIKELAAGIAFEEFGIDLSESAKNIIKGTNLDGPDTDLTVSLQDEPIVKGPGGSEQSIDNVITKDPLGVRSNLKYFSPQKMTDWDALHNLKSRTGCGFLTLPEQLEKLMELWVAAKGQFTEQDLKLLFGEAENDIGLYDYLYDLVKEDVAVSEDIKFFLVLSGALSYNAYFEGVSNISRTGIKLISSAYVDLGVISINTTEYVKENIETRTIFVQSNRRNVELLVKRFDAGFNAVKVIKK